MVNYGYECVGWSPDAKNELAIELGILVDGIKDMHGQSPEIEVG